MHPKPKPPTIRHDFLKGLGLKSFRPRQLVFVVLLGIVMVVLILYRNCSETFI